MIFKDNVFSVRIGHVRLEAVSLISLIRDLRDKRLNRLPILDDEDRPLYVIHRSMFERFITDRLLWSGAGSNPESLTLAEFLGDETMKRTLETSFVVVSQHATLQEAKEKMNSARDCRDVFVTARGGRDEPILGWLTNVRMGRA